MRNMRFVVSFVLIIVMCLVPLTGYTKNVNMNNRYYYLQKVNAQSAWHYLKPSNKVRVVVLDTGVNTNHPEFKSVLNTNLSVDITKPGHPKLFKDLQTHGTHVAGIIGSKSGGVAAVHGKSVIELVVVNVFEKNDKGETVVRSSKLSEGIDYAVSIGAKVINLSLGFEKSSGYLEEACAKAEAAGITVVSSAGNYGNKKAFYPADYDSVISVIAVNKSNQKESYSNYGNEDVSAPGQSIYSTINNGYGYKSGTSMASAIVSGIVAMMYNVNPSLTPKEAREIIIESAKDIGTKGYDKETGFGLVDAKAAVLMAKN
ncbi:MAG: S8 family serine peptidase [Anaerovoracaceae bacterium]